MLILFECASSLRLQGQPLIAVSIRSNPKGVKSTHERHDIGTRADAEWKIRRKHSQLKARGEDRSYEGSNKGGLIGLVYAAYIIFTQVPESTSGISFSRSSCCVKSNVQISSLLPPHPQHPKG
jgi:hypothetical protein